MTRTILDIVKRESEPKPWAEGDNIPWDDPEFSERMLAEHLSQEHDLASRKAETIEQHVKWIHSEVLGSRPARVLDLACGPGLYTLRLAQLGCDCVGIDFSPASIRHAEQRAAKEGASCAYHHADLRDGGFGQDFDLAIMVFGQFNVFPRNRGLEILQRAKRALAAGGHLVLEIQNSEGIEERGGAGPSWYSAESGLFSAGPHIVLQENFWHADSRASTNRFSVIDARSGEVCVYALTNEAYTNDEIEAALRSAGFQDMTWHSALTGQAADDDDFSVVVARC